MAQKSTLYVLAHDPYNLIVEPWAEEFTIHHGQSCALVAIHPTTTPTFTVLTCRSNDLTVFVNEGGATYEFWRDGQLEFSTDIPIPT
jgi:hypothetical protein